MSKRVDFLVIGAQKAGTTALYHFLRQHPGIFMPDRKEVGFFHKDSNFEGTPGPDRYASYHEWFDSAPNGTVWGEATPEYLYHPKTAERIHAYRPDIKLIALLRDPVERAISNHAMHLSRGMEREGFAGEVAAERQKIAESSTALDEKRSYLRRGLYGAQLARFYSRFDASQLLVLRDTDLRDRHKDVLLRVYAFLDIDPPEELPAPQRVFGGAEPQPIPRELDLELRELFRLDLEQAEQLTGLDLTAWMSPADSPPPTVRPTEPLTSHATQPNAEFLPNLFVLGAAKCGTTALHSYLSRFQSVCMSDPKEPFFFECEYDKGLAFYRQAYFAHWAGEPVIGESRHRNLFLPYVPERIAAVNPEARLIVLMRNPVERAVSHWNHYHSRGVERLNFPEAIADDLDRIASGRDLSTESERAAHCARMFPDELKREGIGLYRTYIDTGYYARQILRYLEHFPRAQLLPVLYDELVDPSGLTLAKVLAFLGVDPGPIGTPPLGQRNIGVYQGRRRYKRLITLGVHLNKRLRNRGTPAWLRRTIKGGLKTRLNSGAYTPPPDLLARLYTHFEPHNRELELLLQRRLPASWYGTAAVSK
ncbi:MAG: sulfotransferase domain-containing protein [Planctomycetota bacterium]